MEFLTTFASLFSNFGNLTWQMVVMWAVGGLLIYLAIAKQMEPSLLLPMGFGAILVNLPALRGHYPGGDRGAHHGAVPCGNEPTSCFRCCCSSALVP